MALDAGLIGWALIQKLQDCVPEHITPVPEPAVGLPLTSTEDNLDEDPELAAALAASLAMDEPASDPATSDTHNSEALELIVSMGFTAEQVDNSVCFYNLD